MIDKKEKKLLFDIKALDVWVTFDNSKDVINDKELIDNILLSTIK